MYLNGIIPIYWYHGIIPEYWESENSKFRKIVSKYATNNGNTGNQGCEYCHKNSGIEVLAMFFIIAHSIATTFLA